MPKDIRLNDELKVDVKLEFEGYIANYIIEVENQYIPIIDNEANDHPIKFNGKPILIKGKFVGAKEAEVKTFEVTINGHTAKNNGLSLNKGGLEINDYKPLIYFDLNEVV